MIGRRGNAEFSALAHHIAVEKVDLAGLAARKILRGGRHLVRHDGGDFQDMREEIVGHRYAAGAGDRCRLLHRACDDIPRAFDFQHRSVGNIGHGGQRVEGAVDDQLAP